MLYTAKNWETVMLRLCNFNKWHIMADKIQIYLAFLGQATHLWQNIFWCSWTAIMHYLK